MPLIGANRHQDFAIVGNAATNRLLKEQNALKLTEQKSSTSLKIKNLNIHKGMIRVASTSQSITFQRGNLVCLVKANQSIKKLKTFYFIK